MGTTWTTMADFKKRQQRTTVINLVFACMILVALVVILAAGVRCTRRGGVPLIGFYRIVCLDSRVQR